MAQWVNGFAQKHEDSSSDPSTHTSFGCGGLCNPSTGETDIGHSLGLHWPVGLA